MRTRTVIVGNTTIKRRRKFICGQDTMSQVLEDLSQEIPIPGKVFIFILLKKCCLNMIIHGRKLKQLI